MFTTLLVIKTSSTNQCRMYGKCLIQNLGSTKSEDTNNSNTISGPRHKNAINYIGSKRREVKTVSRILVTYTTLQNDKTEILSSIIS